ncbi:glycosyltransferase family 2 protein [Leifsonia sp. NPDC058230]|uniref:glycosyltransferase family 2 protein n=1 Tax=Leifsonia sp. NPDC058230 TaxID=3346391 RepID=UPI0036D998AC
MSSEPSLSSVAVVTVSYNSSAEMAPFLSSVTESEGAPVRVVVADNDSADASETRRITLDEKATFLPTGGNHGYGGAMNRGVASLGPDIDAVLISNPDVVIHPGAISRLLAVLASSESIGAVGPRVLNPDGSTYPSARALPSLRSGIGHALFGEIWPTNPWSASYRVDMSDVSATRDVGWLSGSCLLVRRSAFEAIGGFDEGFFMYFEDVDLGRRLHEAGWRSVYVPDASVTHTGAHSTSTDSVKMIRAHHASAYRYLKKKYPSALYSPIRLALRIGLAARAQYLIIRARRRRSSVG